MQLVVNVKNEALADKIIKILEVFKNEGVEIKKIIMAPDKAKTRPFISVYF